MQNSEGIANSANPLTYRSAAADAYKYTRSQHCPKLRVVDTCHSCTAHYYGFQAYLENPGYLPHAMADRFRELATATPSLKKKVRKIKRKPARPQVDATIFSLNFHHKLASPSSWHYPSPVYIGLSLTLAVSGMTNGVAVIEKAASRIKLLPKGDVISQRTRDSRKQITYLGLISAYSYGHPQLSPRPYIN